MVWVSNWASFVQKAWTHQKNFKGGQLWPPKRWKARLCNNFDWHCGVLCKEVKPNLWVVSTSVRDEKRRREKVSSLPDFKGNIVKHMFDMRRRGLLLGKWRFSLSFAASLLDSRLDLLHWGSIMLYDSYLFHSPAIRIWTNCLQWV